MPKTNDSGITKKEQEQHPQVVVDKGKSGGDEIYTSSRVRMVETPLWQIKVNGTNMPQSCKSYLTPLRTFESGSNILPSLWAKRIGTLND
jgi:hypothetical protein